MWAGTTHFTQLLGGLSHAAAGFRKFREPLQRMSIDGIDELGRASVVRANASFYTVSCSLTSRNASTTRYAVAVTTHSSTACTSSTPRSSALGLTTRRGKSPTGDAAAATRYGSTARIPSPPISTIAGKITRRNDTLARENVAATNRRSTGNAPLPPLSAHSRLPIRRAGQATNADAAAVIPPSELFSNSTRNRPFATTREPRAAVNNFAQ